MLKEKLEGIMLTLHKYKLSYTSSDSLSRCNKFPTYVRISVISKDDPSTSLPILTFVWSLISLEQSKGVVRTPQFLISGVSKRGWHTRHVKAPFFSSPTHPHALIFLL